MPTVRNSGAVAQIQIIANDTTPDVIFSLPEGCRDYEFRLLGSAVTSARIQQTWSNESEVNAGTEVWESLDSTLDAVGTTAVNLQLGVRSPLFLRLSRLSPGHVATLKIRAKRDF